MADVTINDLQELMTAPDDEDYFVVRDVSGNVDQKVKKSVFLGAAASMPVTQTATDTTTDALTKVGDFGHGAIGEITFIADLTIGWNTRPSGIYRVNATTLGMPSGFSGDAVLQFNRRSGSATSEELDGLLILKTIATDAERANTEMWLMSLRDADFNSADWYSLTPPQDYGIGVELLSTETQYISDLNTATTSGVYRFDNSTSNKPEGIFQGTVFIIGSAYGNITQIAYADSNGAPTSYTRGRVGGFFGSWVATTPQTFGLGSNAVVALNDDLNDITATGYYQVRDTTLNAPTGAVTGGTVSHTQYDGNDATQSYINNDGNESWIRSLTTGTWSAWIQTDPQAFGWGLVDASGSGDLDAITNSGQYAFSSSASNIPEVGANGTLIHSSRNSATSNIRADQTAITNTSNIYIRVNIGGTWNSWTNIKPQAFGWGIDNLSSYSLLTSVDVNTIRTSALYRTTGTMVNLPSGADVDGVLLVMPSSGTETKQIYRPYNTTDVWERSQIASAWGTWINTVPQASGIGVENGINWTTSDLDDVVVSGFYRVLASATNKPAGVVNASVLIHNPYNGAAASQHLTDIGTGNVYTRVITGGTWGDWVELTNQGGGEFQGYARNTYQYTGKRTSMLPVSRNKLNGFCISTDGLNAFSTDESGEIFEHTLTEAFDISTITYTGNSVVPSETANAEIKIFVSNDGLRLYASRQNNGTIYQYDLGTAWDLTTLSYTGNSLFTTNADDNRGIHLSADGIYLFVAMTSTTNDIRRYTLGTPWDLSTAGSSTSFVPSGHTHFEDVHVSPDGYTLISFSSDSAIIVEVELNEPWGFNGHNITNSTDFVATVGSDDALTVAVSPDGRFIYMGGEENSYTFDFDLVQLNFSIKY